MGNEAFGGNKKLPMKSLLARYERKLIDGNVRRFPHWIEGYHLYFIILNCVIICFGVRWIERVLVHVLVISIVVLCIVAYRTQKYIWKLDMAEKTTTKRKDKETPQER